MKNLYNTNIVLGEGKVPCNLMLIGEAPGEEEDTSGKPFSGKAGRTLTSLLKKVGLKREQIYITNAVKQRPPNNRKPTLEEIVAHREYLLGEIDTVNPDIILTMGSTAAQAIMNCLISLYNLRQNQQRGKDNHYQGIDWIATYHPASLFYDKSNLKHIEADLKKFATYA